MIFKSDQYVTISLLVWISLPIPDEYGALESALEGFPFYKSEEIHLLAIVKIQVLFSLGNCDSWRSRVMVRS